MKRLTPLAVILAIVALVIGFAQPGTAATTVSQNFLLFAPGATPVLTIDTQLQCEVQVNSPNATISSTPQYSADGVTWVAAPNINGGSITQPGVYIGNNPQVGYTSFRLNVSNFTGTQLSGSLICGDSLPATPGTGNVNSVNGGLCITATPSVGDIIVSYTCPTPGPQATPSPAATGCGVVSGAWPYLIDTSGCASSGSSGVSLQAVGTPVPQTGSAGVTDRLYAGTLHGSSLGNAPCLAASSGDVINPTSASAPGCVGKSNGKTWKNAACGEVSATHCYAFDYAANCPTYTDTPTATAAPSPVPLATPTPPNTATCGAPGINSDGSTSLAVQQTVIPLPTSILPASGAHSIEVVYRSAAPGVGLFANTFMGLWWIIDNATNAKIGVGIAVPTQTAEWTNNYPTGGVLNTILTVPGGVTYDEIYTTDGSTRETLYINGQLITTVSALPGFGTAGGTLGSGCDNGGPNGCGQLIGRIGGFAIYDVELSQAQVNAHVAALGI